MNDPWSFAVQLALKAGNLLREFFNPAGIHASVKPDHTVVTEADLAADTFITHEIQMHYPNDVIISEESSHLLNNDQTSIWIIDPLDGTTNFSLGLAIWGVSIARIVNGIPALGVLYFPIINELYTTRRGSGSFLNQKSILVRAPDPSQPMSFFACCSRSFRYYNISVPYKPRIMGSAAYTFCMVARGSALLGFDAAPKIWDLAAAWLLVEQAGGKIAAFEGSPAFPISSQDNFSLCNYPTLAAATPEVFLTGQKKIQRKSKFAFVVQDKDLKE
ncbi:MAG: inositol monophosphatase family protein [Anaerolineales bacterium]